MRIKFQKAPLTEERCGYAAMIEPVTISKLSLNYFN